MSARRTKIEKACILLGATLLVPGCQGEVGGESGPSDTVGMVGGASAAGASAGSTASAGADPTVMMGGGSTANGGAATTSPECASATVDPGPAPIRRLNRLEYDNAVRDLLNTTLQPATGFPTEEIALGFDDNGQALTVSPALAEQYMNAAEQLATDAVKNHYADLVTCDPASAGVDACGQTFITSFARKAYRHPPDADDMAVLTAVFNAGKATDFKTGVRLVIETALQAPRFLYRVEFGSLPASGTQAVRLDDYEMAARLSFLLWRSIPDAKLNADADAHRLSDDAGIAAAAERMLADPRAHAVVRDFHDQWLGLGEIASIQKDSAVFPKFTSTVAGLMQQEAEMYVDDVVWSASGKLDDLFTGAYTFANGPLAAYYGLSGVSGNSFVKVPVDPSRQAGLLTQGGLLSLLAKSNQTSPVLRGKFVREQLLCTILPPPPPDVDITLPELSSTLTTRQRFNQHSVDPSCSACHRLMDPIGLGFETFDAAGVYRSTENGQKVDASGQINDGGDLSGAFNGPVELEKKLASGADLRSCAVTQWFRYGYGRGETAADSCSMTALKTTFAAGNYKILSLVAGLTSTPTFRYRRVTAAAGVSP